MFNLTLTVKNELEQHYCSAGRSCKRIGSQFLWYISGTDTIFGTTNIDYQSTTIVMSF